MLIDTDSDWFQVLSAGSRIFWRTMRFETKTNTTRAQSARECTRRARRVARVQGAASPLVGVQGAKPPRNFFWSLAHFWMSEMRSEVIVRDFKLSKMKVSLVHFYNNILSKPHMYFLALKCKIFLFCTKFPFFSYAYHKIMVHAIA